MTQVAYRIILAGGMVGLTGAPAWPHAAEQGFVLLLPTGIYITAGTLAVCATILLLAVLPFGAAAGLFSTRELIRRRGWPLLRGAGSLLGTAVYGALILVGLYGPSDPQANMLPLVVWTLWWVALFAVQALVADIWGWLNPWRALHRLVVGDAPPPLSLPDRLGAWPAVLVFLAFQGFVLADIAPNDPGRLARFALGYWLVTFLGMSLFGRQVWLTRVECFTVMFRLIGVLRPVGGSGCLKLGVPGWRGLQAAPLTGSFAAFCLVLLASGSFDGLHETFWWLGLIGVNPLEFPGRSALVWHTTAGLIAANLLLVLLFAGALWAGRVAAHISATSVPLGLLLRAFAVTLLPIGLGYHVAHYLVTFLVQIQYVAASLADPLVWGWDLFGLGSVTIKTGFLATPSTVQVIWLSQAGVVVASHILSVLMAHSIAEHLCADRRQAVRLQLGLGVLMVAYTIFGLWLLASPRGA